MKNWKVIQNDSKDCGVACILAVIRYFKGNYPLESLREKTKVNKYGCTALDIVNTLKYCGFEASGYNISLNELRNVNLPAIIHFNIDQKYLHFVVLYEITKSYVKIMDPAHGFVKMKINEFNSKYDNIAILLNPVSKIVNIKDEKDINQIFTKELINNSNIVFKIIMISIIVTILSIVSGYYLKFSLNNINQENTIINLKLITIIFIIITIMKNIYDYLKNNLEIYLNKRINNKITYPFITHLYQIPLYSLKSRSVGEIVSRIYDLDNVREVISTIYINLILDTILAIGTIIMLLFINNQLTIILIIIILLYFINSYILKKRIKNKIENSIVSETEYNKYLIDTLNGITSLKACNRIDYFKNLIKGKINNYLKDKYALDQTINNDLFFKNLINDLGFLIINIIGINLITQNKISIVDLITFNTISSYILVSIKNIANMIPKIAIIKNSFNRINDFINIREEEIHDSNEFTTSKITLNNLGMSYNNKNIFKNINIEINNNEKVWLVGKSGCGKSTICKIIYGLIDNYDGEVLINDINLKDYDIATIRKNISYVSQDEALFQDTIKNNILLGKDISDDKFNLICQMCLLEDVVKNKPFRYETMLGEMGCNLSGGEKQRIILARMLINDSKILILDEALSEVNSQIEETIIKNIIKEYKDKTIIYVSHHLNNVFKRKIRMDAI